ncbi:MAG TPA: hypothetical protein VF187_10300 [Gemmatimonadales bacterium]
MSNGRIFGAAVVLALVATRAAAQGSGDCRPPRDSHEAQTMAIFAVPLAFSAVAAPGGHPSGRVQVGLEVSLVPNVDRETATPTFCRPDKGPEHTDVLFAAPRPRVSLALPAGFQVEGSWSPPIRIAEVKANLLAFAVSRATRLNRSGAVLSLRAHGSFGVIKAPITCDDAALEDAASICYQGTRSDDSYKPNVIGLEASVGWRLGPALRPYIGAGVSHLAPRFQVNFTDQFGFVDRRKVIVDLERGALFAGLTWSATPALELSGELYSVPTDATTGRVIGRIRLGR